MMSLILELLPCKGAPFIFSMQCLKSFLSHPLTFLLKTTLKVSSVFLQYFNIRFW